MRPVAKKQLWGWYLCQKSKSMGTNKAKKFGRELERLFNRKKEEGGREGGRFAEERENCGHERK